MCLVFGRLLVRKTTISVLLFLQMSFWFYTNTFDMTVVCQSQHSSKISLMLLPFHKHKPVIHISFTSFFASTYYPLFVSTPVQLIVNTNSQSHNHTAEIQFT